MAQTKCTGTGVTDCRADLINKWLALPSTEQLGIDLPKKWSFSVSNILLIKAVYMCFEKVHSRGLSGRRNVVGVLFLCLLLLSFFLCCAFSSLKLEEWLIRTYSSATAKGPPQPLSLWHPHSLCALTWRKEELRALLMQKRLAWGYRLFLEEYMCTWEYDLSLERLIYDAWFRPLLNWTTKCQYRFYCILCEFP